MLLSIIGLLLGLAAAGYQIYFLYFEFFAYLTNITLTIHIITLAIPLLSDQQSEFYRILMIISWTEGWIVTILFWIYVFPLIDQNLLPPAWNYVITHGILNLIMSKEFLEMDSNIKVSDIKYPLYVILGYIALVLFPFKLKGVILYPLLFDEVVPTIIIISGSTILCCLSFFVGLYIKQVKKIKVG